MNELKSLEDLDHPIVTMEDALNWGVNALGVCILVMFCFVVWTVWGFVL